MQRPLPLITVFFLIRRHGYQEGHPEQGPRVPAILDALEKHQLRGMQCNTQASPPQ